MARERKEPVVVIGLGRFGSALALDLNRRGTEVLAIDSSAKVVQHHSGQLTQVVAADCTDIEALRELGVDEFYKGVVAIGSDIEASILVTSLLVELGVEDIWAKAITAHHGRILERVGAHHVVFPEREAGERVAHLVSGQMINYMQVESDFAIAEVRSPHQLVGIPLAQAGLRKKFGITVVAVKNVGGTFTDVTPDTELTYDDVVLVTGRVNDLERFVNLA